MRTCIACEKPLPPAKPGRERLFCTDKCRKVFRYAGSCEVCGGPTNGYDGPGTAAARCKDCVTIWTPEAVIASIQAWADEHGGIPPSQVDWNPWHTRHHATELREYEAWKTRIPSHSTVSKVFGSWNAGIAAAGFKPRYVHQSPEVRREAVRRWLAGETRVALAAEYDVSPNAIDLWKRDPRYNPELRS